MKKARKWTFLALFVPFIIMALAVYFYLPKPNVKIDHSKKIDSEDGKFIELSGDVRYKINKTDKYFEVSKDQSFSFGDSVYIGQNSVASILFNQKHNLHIQSHTHVAITSPNENWIKLSTNYGSFIVDMKKEHIVSLNNYTVQATKRSKVYLEIYYGNVSIYNEFGEVIVNYSDKRQILAKNQSFKLDENKQNKQVVIEENLNTIKKKKIVNQKVIADIGQVELKEDYDFIVLNKEYGPEVYEKSDIEISDIIRLNQEPLMISWFELDLAYNYRLVFEKIGDDIGGAETSGSLSFIFPYYIPGRYEMRVYGQRGSLKSKTAKTVTINVTMEAPKKINPIVRGPSNTDTNIAWTKILFADEYQLQVSKSKNFLVAKNYSYDDNFTNLPLEKSGSYHWKVRALKNGKPISEYSDSYLVNFSQTVLQTENWEDEDASEPKKSYIVAKSVAQNPLLQAFNEDVGVTETYSFDDDIQMKGSNPVYAWLGLGNNIFGLDEKTSAAGDTISAIINYITIYAQLSYFWKPDLRYSVAYSSTPVLVTETGETFQGNRTVLGGEAAWSPWKYNLPYINKEMRWGIQGGLQNHNIPVSGFDSSGDSELANVSLINAFFGMNARLDYSEKFSYEGFMNYQLPLATSMSGLSEYTVSDQFSFDGSLGAIYRFTERLKAGFFWYGQFHSLQFSNNNVTGAGGGDQNLFNSTMDLRFGYDF